MSGSRGMVRRSLAVMGVAMLAGLLASAEATAGPPGVRIVPPQARPLGKSYAEWGAEWWKWAAAIPAASNPTNDTTGEFAGQDQCGWVWFLAGSGSRDPVTRTVTVPVGRFLFFPIINTVWWAPDDIPFAIEVATELGFDSTRLSNEELLSILVNFLIPPTTEVSLTIDGVQYSRLQRFRIETVPFTFEDTTLFDDDGIPIAEENTAISIGYWIMLPPLSRGRHTIRFTAQVPDGFSQDVTYRLTVGRR